MKEYHKIQSVFKRDMSKKGRLILGDWTLPEFDYLKDNIWTFTEKVDGANIRVMFDGENVSFGGKTDNAQIPSRLVDRLRQYFPNESKFINAFGPGNSQVCLYGEGYGAGIQKIGGLYKQSQDFVLFDVKIGDWWLQRGDVEDVANKLGLDVVPIVGEGTLVDCINMVQTGLRSVWGDFRSEGIVARPKTELCTRGGQRLITKIKHCDFQEL